MSDIDLPEIKKIVDDSLSGSATEGTPVEKDDSDSLSFNLAGLSSRGLAFFIDVILIAITAFLACWIGIYLIADPSEGLNNIFVPIYILLFFLASSYFVVLNGYSGKTVGKMVMGIRIISDDGDPVGFWQSFVRWIGYYISSAFLFLGFVWSIFDSKSQSWHDKISGTYVVED